MYKTKRGKINLTQEEFLSAVEDNRVVIMKVRDSSFRIFIINNRNFYMKNVLINDKELITIRGVGVDKHYEVFDTICYLLELGNEVPQRFQKQ